MARLLVKIGWNVQTSLEEGRKRGIENHIWSEQSDANQAAVARELNRIFVGFDEFKGRSGAEVAAELTLNGGRIIQISRGPNQSTYRSLAKLLWHFDEWRKFLTENEGVVILRDTKQIPALRTVDEYRRDNTFSDLSRRYFEEYMTRWQERVLSPLEPRPTLTPEQRLLMKPLVEDDPK